MARRPRRRRPATALPVVLVRAVPVLVAAVALLYVGLTARDGLPLSSSYEVDALFTRVPNVSAHDDVRIGGRRVGQVLRLRRDGRGARVTLQLDRSVDPLRTDSRVRVRAVGLLGAHYLDVVPGEDGTPLASGDVLPAARTSAAVQLPEFLGAFDAEARRGLRRTLVESGKGLLGRGEVANVALEVAPDYFEDLGASAAAVTARTGAAARLVRSAGALMRALAPVRESLAGGLRPTGAALAPFVVERRSLHRLLDDAPSAFRAIRGGLDRSDPLLAVTDDLLGATRRLTVSAPSALRATARLLRSARDPVREADALVAATARTAPAARRLLERIDPAIPAVRETLTGAGPLLQEVGRRRCDITGFARNWRDFLQYGVPGGADDVGPLNVLRFDSVISAETVAGAGPAIALHDVGRNPRPEPCARVGGAR